ncbi:MAG: hypothetical protein M1812_005475 [Candelaria pacifica]|nr:MAG: hypothetical protein M1812_005475 [Candelaria pacifica]
MSGAHLNPLLPNGYGTNSVVQNGSANPYSSTTYRTDMVGASRAKSASTIQPVPIDRSRTRIHSPDSRLGPLIPPPEQAQRRKRSNSNSIVGHLQIPSTINNSKGSLAEFAAQITCLFWFESSSRLHRVEEAKTTPTPTTPLVAEAVPFIGFQKWVTTILSTTQVTQNVILLALMFIYRLKKLNPTVKGKPGSEFRLLTVALMLGNKFLDDNTYTNKTWAEVSGISVQEIHIMEVEFLSNMRYSLFTSEEEWKEWHVKLGRFFNYFDKASRTPLEMTPRPPGPPTPTLHVPPPLPSPPGSTHTSPPFRGSHPPCGPALPLPHSTPHHAPQTVPSPAFLPDLDLKANGRKRSYDDQSNGPPAKRIVTRSMVPSNLSSTTLAPSTLPAPMSNMPRLPVPNLSISTGPPVNGYGKQIPAQLPPPGGRSMSTVFPGTSTWSQPGFAPSSTMQGGGQLTPTGVSFSPYGDQSRHQTPFPTSSATSSPTSASFPVHTPSQTRLSPSYFLTHRNSPYRPVRHVNTLLVPPPSASMHNPTKNMNFDQMHYQPLGKSISERKTGVVPYMPMPPMPPIQWQPAEHHNCQD